MIVYKPPKLLPESDISDPRGMRGDAPYKEAPSESHKPLKGDRQGSREMLFSIKDIFYLNI